MRVLVCAVAAVTLILAGALAMDWYGLSFEAEGVGRLRIAIDLRSLHLCYVAQVCASTPLSPLPGMFPTLAAVTMWSSLGVAALVGVQAGLRLVTGSGHDALTRLGYMVSLMAISIAVATAYMFGPEHEGSMIGAAAEAGVVLHRTWGPLTLIAGLVAGFATLYIATAPESSDLDAAYKPVALPAARAMSETRTRTPAVRIPFPEHTGLFPMPERGATGGATTASAMAAGTTPIPRRDLPGSELPAAAPPADRVRQRPTTAPPARAPTDPRTRATADPPGATTELRAARAPTVTGIQPMRAPTAVGSQRIDLRPPTRAPRARTESVTPTPDHLRNQLSYVALTAEITAGGIDARREDGSARLVLWRDVVGVVARRMPPAYDATVFIDVVSTAGSTLRIVPWTRLTGEPLTPARADRPRSFVEHVAAHCPGAKLDRATRYFLETGEAAQLPDVETLRAHDARLA
jgi:hypothetical protein